jgi:ubiquinone/menaquinone biosynthesis C-methylase UbiE
VQETTPQRLESGQALYSRAFLSIYDRVALGFFCHFVWKCPSRHVLELYNRHVSANHLDAGVGTGYFLDHCNLPAANPRLAILDLNPNSLEKAGKRLSRFKPEIYHSNVLEPIQINAPNFDSVGFSHVLHCLPGTMKTKATAFEHLQAVLNPGGVLFGSTFLYIGAKPNPPAKLLMLWNNAIGLMGNKEDDLEGLERNLRHCFSESSIKVIGCAALFWARK